MTPGREWLVSIRLRPYDRRKHPYQRFPCPCFATEQSLSGDPSADKAKKTPQSADINRPRLTCQVSCGRLSPDRPHRRSDRPPIRKLSLLLLPGIRCSIRVVLDRHPILGGPGDGPTWPGFLRIPFPSCPRSIPCQRDVLVARISPGRTGLHRRQHGWRRSARRFNPRSAFTTER